MIQNWTSLRTSLLFSFIWQYCRLETVDLKRKTGMLKILGATLCVAGAMVLTLYKGRALTRPSQNFPSSQHQEESTYHIKTWKWFWGSIALFGACFSWSSWFLVQSKILKIYPALYTSTTVMFFQSFLQTLVLSLVTQRRASVWAFRSKLEIATVLYSVSKCWYGQKNEKIKTKFDFYRLFVLSQI